MENTYQELKLLNGKTVKLTINFSRLLKLKNRQKEHYSKIMEILTGKEIDIIEDSLEVIYVGYLCANLEQTQVLSEEQFIELVPFDIGTINEIAGNLVMSKKK